MERLRLCFTSVKQQCYDESTSCTLLTSAYVTSCACVQSGSEVKNSNPNLLFSIWHRKGFQNIGFRLAGIAPVLTLRTQDQCLTLRTLERDANRSLANQKPLFGIISSVVLQKANIQTTQYLELCAKSQLLGQLQQQ